jgi:hypothetical protein
LFDLLLAVAVPVVLVVVGAHDAGGARVGDVFHPVGGVVEVGRRRAVGVGDALLQAVRKVLVRDLLAIPEGQRF